MKSPLNCQRTKKSKEKTKYYHSNIHSLNQYNRQKVHSKRKRKKEILEYELDTIPFRV